MMPTPNPNAMKFITGVPVGGPVTYVAGQAPDEGFAAELLALDGVSSIFMTADFVTVSKTADGDWSVIGPAARQILEAAFGA